MSVTIKVVCASVKVDREGWEFVELAEPDPDDRACRLEDNPLFLRFTHPEDQGFKPRRRYVITISPEE